MKLDFVIAASPTPGFFSQISFFKRSLNALGADYANARVVAVFGNHLTETLPAQWRRMFDDIEVEWAHPIGAHNPDYKAQHDRRFEIIRADADLAIICDADVAMLSPFDDLAQQLIQRSAVGGVISHFHFPWSGRERDPDVQWPELARAVLGRADISRPHRYSLLPLDTPPSAPFYINYGVFAGPPDVLAEFYQRDIVLREPVAELIGHYWGAQVSLAMTCADLQLPTIALPMRYNFPNDPTADALYPEELDQIIFLHYLRTKHFKRDAIFADPSAFDTFIQNKFEGSNEVFRRHVQKITEGVFPFSL